MKAASVHPQLREADVIRQVLDWMLAKGWVSYRLQSGLVRGATRGTFIKLNRTGTPDFIFTRADRCLFFEAKGPKKKLRPAQENWFAIAKLNGTPAIWADSLEMFMAKYAEMELQ